MGQQEGVEKKNIILRSNYEDRCEQRQLDKQVRDCQEVNLPQERTRCTAVSNIEGDTHKGLNSSYLCIFPFKIHSTLIMSLFYNGLWGIPSFSFQGCLEERHFQAATVSGHQTWFAGNKSWRVQMVNSRSQDVPGIWWYPLSHICNSVAKRYPLVVYHSYGKLHHF